MVLMCGCIGARTKMKPKQAAFVGVPFNIYLEHVPLCLFPLYYQNICLLVSLGDDWTKFHMLVGPLCMIQAGIGSQLCHSEIKYSDFLCPLFPGAALEGGEWIFPVWVAGASSASFLLPVLDWVCTQTRLTRSCLSSLFLCHISSCVCVHSCCLFKYFTLGIVFFFLLLPVVLLWSAEHLSSKSGALMGGSANSGWDWGCWTEVGRACLSWDSSSSSRGSTRLPSTASSAACWGWPTSRASPHCPTAYTRWAHGPHTFSLCLILFNSTKFAHISYSNPLICILSLSTDQDIINLQFMSNLTLLWMC